MVTVLPSGVAVGKREPAVNLSMDLPNDIRNVGTSISALAEGVRTELKNRSDKKMTLRLMGYLYTFIKV